MLSEDVKHIIEWLNNNFLYLNYSKTKVMLTGRHERFALVDSFTVRAGDTVLSRVYQFKYLGVMLNPYPSWNDHIDYIGYKISAKLDILNKAHQVIPRESCFFTVFITPWYFQYSTTALLYGTPTVRLAESTWISCIGVPPVLLKAAQSHNRRYLTLPVGRRSRRKKNMLVYKNLHGLAPACLLHEFSHARDFHSYNTHHGNLLCLLLAQTTKYQGSFRFSGVKIWNTLPLALRSEHDLNKFGFGPKRHFRSKPNWASNTLATLSCSNFLCYCFVFVFLFISAPFKPASLKRVPLTKYWSK